MDTHEKILVLVRLRPLSEKEVERNEVVDWECINDTTILYRNSIQEHSRCPTTYTYDRVFRGDSSTKEVYEEGVKEIALSVLNGINSTIFAYGQTSSGKTYTMTGITEYTVADIYDYIHRHEERDFILKFSALEIYNEAVRDLLSTDDMPLRVLDDPEKGAVVERLTDETLTDLSHLKQLLSACQALRRTGETALNGTSSRSHQILRLTIESSAREFSGNDKSTKLSASVNFVDLAGSERASLAMSDGTRLKEGCHINRSLLTLGTVIRKLSKGKQGHINYRDSKLTRILQPSLGGNARTAIICTLSPARSHVEQSRNTLLFASCAKEVSTNARVNVVISDKSLVQTLQKQLARLENELRMHDMIDTNQDYAELIRKKDLQIEKMDKDIQEISRLRKIAEARVEDLLLVIERLQSEKMDKHDQTWEEDGHLENDFTYNKLGARRIIDALMTANHNGNDSVGRYKAVRCMEQSESGQEDFSNLNVHPDQEDTDTTTSFSAETPNNASNSVNHVKNDFSNHTVGQSIGDSLTTESSLEEFHQVSSAREMSGSKPLKRGKGQSHRTYVSGLSPPSEEKMKLVVSHSPTSSTLEGLSESERLEPFERKLMPSHIDNSQYSIESAFMDPHAKSSRDWQEDVHSIHEFVEGLKEAKLQYEEQLDGQETFLHERLEGDSKDISLEYSGPQSDWPRKFARLQKAIIYLWQSCNVSLVHRTYFYLLFKGDPTDSIYMEVELRRLAFLKQTYSDQNQLFEDGQPSPINSSEKALHRERIMLSRLMQKRYTKEERNMLFHKWGIDLHSKKRKLQLLNSIWTSTTDFHQITESAEIVARLIKFSEQSEAIKGMFGLSFSTPWLNQRYHGWKNSIATLIQSSAQCSNIVLNSSTTKE